MEYKLQEGIYFTDFGKRMNNPNNANNLKCTFANETIYSLAENLQNVNDTDLLCSMLEEFKEKIRSLIESNSDIISSYDYIKDNDLLDALTENFNVIQKYFGYIETIKKKLKEKQSKHATYHDSELDSLLVQFQKLNVCYTNEDNGMKLEKNNEQMDVEEEPEATGISLYI